MNQENILQQTLSGLEAGLHVRHIATRNPECWHDRDEINSALVAPHLADFDQIPVKEDDRIVGVIERNVHPAADEPPGLFRQLDDSLVVAAEEPLSRFLRYMTQRPKHEYQLVVGDNRIDAIVTRSDLLKLPVRIYAFTLITHLESLMASIIQAKLPDREVWKQYLAEDRQERIREKLKQAASDRIDPSPIEFTDFCDKREIVRRHLKLPSRFEKDLGRIERVRNSVAHAGVYAETQEGLRKFLNTVERTQYWIDELGSAL